MLNIFTKTIKKSQKARSLEELVFQQPYHKWIIDDRYNKASFSELLESIPQKFHKHFYDKEILFLKGNGKWALALETMPNTKVVIVFEDLIKLLRSGAPRLAQAVLAHEIGHLVYNHSNIIIDKLEAQVQADQFAMEIGYGKELSEVLIDIADKKDSIELRVRISYLTSHLISKDHGLDQ